MKMISRRQFLYISTPVLLTPLWPAVWVSAETGPRTEDLSFPITISVLSSAYRSEQLTSEHYTGYCRKAVEENFPNIAYLFAAFAVSEKIHAENYQKILTSLRAAAVDPRSDIIVLDTKTNLIAASEGELEKIRRIYPDFLAKLKQESHDQAVISCMYSWKSHRQHKRKISAIRRYSHLFFGTVARKIEGMTFDFHVCEICGSTVDEAPQTPCDICNYPVAHYRKVARPG